MIFFLKKKLDDRLKLIELPPQVIMHMPPFLPQTLHPPVVRNIKKYIRYKCKKMPCKKSQKTHLVLCVLFQKKLGATESSPFINQCFRYYFFLICIHFEAQILFTWFVNLFKRKKGRILRSRLLNRANNFDDVKGAQSIDWPAEHFFPPNPVYMLHILCKGAKKWPEIKFGHILIHKLHP